MIINQLNNNHSTNLPLPNNPTTITTTNYTYTVITLNPNPTALSDPIAKKQAAKELVFNRFKEVLSRLY